MQSPPLRSGADRQRAQNGNRLSVAQRKGGNLLGRKRPRGSYGGGSRVRQLNDTDTSSLPSNSNSISDNNADGHADTSAGADRHPNSEPYRVSNPDQHPNGHRNSHGNVDSNKAADSHLYSYPNPETDPHPHTNPHCNTNPHAEADSDCDPHTNSDPHSDSDPDPHGNSNRNANLHPATDANLDPDSKPDLHLAAVRPLNESVLAVSSRRERSFFATPLKGLDRLAFCRM